MQDFLPLLATHLIVALKAASALVGEADAEDAVQEAIIRAWRAWPEMRERNAVRSWFLRITINVCHNWRSGRFGTHQRLTIPFEAHQDVAAPVEAEPGESPHLARMDLHEAVETLAEPFRQVVVLRYFIGLDATEIGEILGIPPGTVRARLRRALILLRAHLDDPAGQRLNQNEVDHV